MWIPEEGEEGPEMKKCELNALKRATERDGGRDTGEDMAPEENRTDLSVSQSAFMNDWSVHLHECLARTELSVSPPS